MPKLNAPYIRSFKKSSESQSGVPKNSKPSSKMNNNSIMLVLIYL